MLAPEDIAARARPGLHVAGDALDILRPAMPETVVFCPAPEIEAVTAARLAAAAPTDNAAFLPRPLYLRAPDVTLGKAGA
jgi:hypothetical protein